MHKQRLGILLLAALGMVATFLPWIKVPILGTIDGTDSDGWITLGLFAIPLIFNFLGSTSDDIKEPMLYGAVIPSIIAGIIGLRQLLKYNDEASTSNFFDKLLGSVVSVEPGLYLVVIAGFALPVVAFMLKGSRA